jgi:hypothetical protein
LSGGEADLTVYVHDASAPWGEEERTAWRRLPRGAFRFNKTDIAPPDGAAPSGSARSRRMPDRVWRRR